MIDPPTDRLHKFLAVGGIALLIAGVTLPLERFNDAELRRIDAFEKAQQFRYAYSDFAEKVNEGIDAHNHWVKKPTPENAQRVKDVLRDNEAVIEQLDLATREAGVKLKKQVDLAVHYHFIRNIWFAIGAFSVIFGILTSWYGFSRWFREPKRSR